jgi:hypothetical protein
MCAHHQGEVFGNLLVFGMIAEWSFAWPCNCYPNHAQRQTNDWMAEIYERWTAAHAVAELRSGRLQASQPTLSRPRPK